MTHLQSATVAVFLVCTSFFFIGSGGRLIPVQAMVTSAVPPQFRGSFMALNSALQQFTMGIITLIGGLIITNNEKGELQHYHIVGYIAVVGTILSLIIAKRIRVVS
jgi:MFS family permease